MDNDPIYVALEAFSVVHFALIIVSRLCSVWIETTVVTSVEQVVEEICDGSPTSAAGEIKYT